MRAVAALVVLGAAALSGASRAEDALQVDVALVASGSTTIELGGACDLGLRIKNASAKRLVVMLPVEFSFVISRPVTCVWSATLDGKVVPRRTIQYTDFVHGPLRKADFIELAPGATHDVPIGRNDAVTFLHDLSSPGVYSVSLTYEFKRPPRPRPSTQGRRSDDDESGVADLLQQAWEGQATTPPLKITVRR